MRRGRSSVSEDNTVADNPVIGKKPPLRCPAIFWGVEIVVLGLAAVDGHHGEFATEDEEDGLAFAEVGEPVPGEHALAADDESLAVRLDVVEKSGGRAAEI